MPPATKPENARSARRSSLADVAALAGVSPGTVSRALSRPEMISPATRERVLSAANRLGYVANGAARALALRRTGTVAALVPRLGGSSFATMVQALESTLAAAGYTLLLAAPESGRSDEAAIVRTLLERGVDAVAVLGADRAPAVFQLLQSHRTPFVLLWAESSPQGLCVGFDEAQAAELVVEHLAGLGHRLIGYIGGRTASNERARRRVRGVMAAVARRGLTLVPDATLETDYGFREGFEALNALLARRTGVTAVICGNDYLAAGALAAADQAGVAVPQALSVASFNDNEFAPYLHPPLTTVHIPIREMGEEAGRLLLRLLAREAVDQPACLPVALRVRGSTAAATGVKARAAVAPGAPQGRSRAAGTGTECDDGARAVPAHQRPK
jgi:LacI family transcriptional regulator